MNKAKMYFDLQKWIESGISDCIYDSPHQRAEYAPYVVELLLKKTPLKQIPFLVLEQLESELVELNIPKKKRWLW